MRWPVLFFNAESSRVWHATCGLFFNLEELQLKCGSELNLTDKKLPGLLFSCRRGTVCASHAGRQRLPAPVAHSLFQAFPDTASFVMGAGATLGGKVTYC